jgi:site-specific DNA-methyltransferase (adenine-specific)
MNNNVKIFASTIEDEAYQQISVDCVISDVAYKITPRGSCGSMSGFMKDKSSLNGKIFKSNSLEIEDYVNELYRVLKDKTFCYIMCNNLNLPHFLKVITEQTNFNFVKCLIWDKCQVICGKYYMGCYEYIIMLRKGGDRPINDCGTKDIIRVSPPKNKRKFKDGSFVNPTEKPSALFEILIRNSSNKGDIILDPFCGSGTIARACINTDRKYIGFDLDERQIQYAKDEIQHIHREQYLFK